MRYVIFWAAAIVLIISTSEYGWSKITPYFQPACCAQCRLQGGGQDVERVLEWVRGWDTGKKP
jgi:hypothetical protein